MLTGIRSFADWVCALACATFDLGTTASRATPFPAAAPAAPAFANRGLERSRSIILATDNQVIDPDNEQIYPLPDAAKLLAERKIRLIYLSRADADEVVVGVDDSECLGRDGPARGTVRARAWNSTVHQIH